MAGAAQVEQAERRESAAGAPVRVQPEQLLVEDPLRAILRLAAPTTLVMLIAATSNVLYTYYVSRLGSGAIAAVSLVFPISLLAITAMGGGLGAGAASAIARALGGGRTRDAAAIAEHALVMSVVVGLLFALTILAGARGVFALMGGTGEVLDQAVTFARVLFGGAAISFTAAMFDSIMRGEGNVRVPAIWSSASLLLQVLVTPLFMFVAGWGLVGAALAMLACQFLATIPRARYVFGGRGAIRPRPWPRRPAIDPVLDILRVGIPASLSTTTNYIGMMVLTGVVARLGTGDLAAYGLGVRLDFLLISFAYGFSAAVLTLVGLATGAGRPERAALYVVRAGAVIVALLGVCGMMLCWRPDLWLGLFTDDAEIHAVGAQYFRYIGPSYPFIGIAMVIAFAFQGLGRATAPLLFAVVRVIAVLAVAIVCTQWLGLQERAVFATIAAGNVCSAAAMVWLFWRRIGFGKG
jgi:putative MATE family efflux protein